MEASLDERIENWDVNPQLQSTFFNALPAEIRLQIYRNALASFSLTAIPPAGAQSMKPHNFRIRFDHEGGSDDDLRGKPGHEREAEMPDIVPELANAAPGCTRPNERPDFYEEPCMSLNMLLSCRRLLTEARPIMFEAERNYQFSSDPRSTLLNYSGGSAHQGFLDRNRELQWEKRFRRVRFFAPISKYHAVFSHHSNLLIHVKHLRITVRRTDWRLGVVSGQPEATGIPPAACFGWVQGPLQINPLGPPAGPLMDRFRETRHENLNIGHMGAMMKTTSEFGRIPQGSVLKDSAAGRPSWMPPQVRYTAGMWGREFVNMPCIKTFTMDFDATQDKRDQLAAIVEWAVRTWRFPLNPAHGGHHYLAADESSVKRKSWRGTAGDWDWLGPCATCRPRVEGTTGGELAREAPELCLIPVHANIVSKFRRGLGPRMYSWSVTWTPRSYEGPEEFPYKDSECLEVLPGDLK
ncbi:hypothetical protein MCOR27_011254 [Pyricularia oryzae]|uniref:Uncharacterized protein n=2 Tax=Pyricularia TaxID=48558 RepID=A0ABQ8NMX5_PYRGI|nr:hypothetical protein MCOR01_004920 [Pyricularia oryzae]KAI6298613.1 hypothetical protein MCOR33_005263 [Pyricularia grisea]KAH9431663.1 hypothetical protein MCOR02_008953 [Pyricularia oryzae]KAI6252308.1 hypothetical protein MCOR19_011081 [Pyricularia oryzae]KAI6265837.1 hypothetical protein MCOR27_011254 [Pyricularia oryzae]